MGAFDTVCPLVCTGATAPAPPPMLPGVATDLNKIYWFHAACCAKLISFGSLAIPPRSSTLRFYRFVAKRR